MENQFEFEWNIIPGFSSLQILQKIHNDLRERNIEPEKFTDWIITQHFSCGKLCVRMQTWIVSSCRFSGKFGSSKINIGENPFFFVSHEFVPNCWNCKHQSVVSQNSTEADMISLDAGLRLKGISAMNLHSLK